ncbi:MAG: hypothetical protein R6W92_17015 [Desulfocurvibacter africanus]
MTLDAELRRARDVLFAIDGRPATYGGTELNVLVGGRGQMLEQDPAIVVGDMDIQVKVEDMPNPRRGDAVVIEGRAYRVAGSPSGDGLTWALTLNKDLG